MSAMSVPELAATPETLAVPGPLTIDLRYDVYGARLARTMTAEQVICWGCVVSLPITLPVAVWSWPTAVRFLPALPALPIWRLPARGPSSVPLGSRVRRRSCALVDNGSARGDGGLRTL